MRNVCGPKRDEVTGEWRRLHGEELQELYYSPNVISGEQNKKNEMGGACSAYGEEERGIEGFGEEIQGKEPTRKV
jgi:hypothetical protein